MRKRLHIDHMPKTPGGMRLNVNEIDVDEIVFDSEISIKSSLIRECKPGNAWFEEGELEPDEEPKFVARKSIDLRKIRSPKDKLQAILNSPMVDARPRRVSYSKSFTERPCGNDDNTLSPLRLPAYKDHLSSTSRRLSRLVMRRHSSLREPVNCKDPTSLLRTFERMHNQLVAEGENIDPQAIQTKSAVTPRNQTADNDDVVMQITNNDNVQSVADFRTLSDMETARLQLLCGDWNGVLSEESDNLPEVAVDSIRVAVGQCQLLLSKKMTFFQQLLDMAEESGQQKDESSPKTGISDLLGYWSLVADEIKRLDGAFERLRIWRDDYHWLVEKRPQTPARPPISARGRTSTKSGNRAPTYKHTRIPIIKTRGSRIVSNRNNLSKLITQTSKLSDSQIGKSRFAQFLEERKAFKVSTPPKVTPPSRRSKRISFATDLSRTPGGHDCGSGDSHTPLPLTPANINGSIVAINRVQRRPKI